MGKAGWEYGPSAWTRGMCSYPTGWSATGGLGSEGAGLGALDVSASAAGPKIKREDFS